MASYSTTGLINPATIVNDATTLTKEQFLQLLQSLDKAYHNGDEIVPDPIYDQLVQMYVQKYGPYLAVGAPPVTGQKVRLPYYLSSLDKITEANHLIKWQKNFTGPYIIEDKVDGITILVIARTDNTGQRQLSLYTRGGGTEGLDVTHLVPYLKLPVPPVDAAIRGELVMNRTDFEKYGAPAGFRNARGLVAGQMAAQNGLRLELVQLMSFYAYRIITMITTPEQEITTLREWGYLTPQPVTTPTLSMDMLTSYYKTREEEAPYEMDGLVIYDNHAHPYPTDDYPSHVIAFKTVGQTAVVTVSNIQWHETRGQRITPVVQYPTVILNDTECSNVTGINGRFIVASQIGPGAQLLITKAGNTIPKILSVIKPAPQGPSYPDKAVFGNYIFNGVDFISEFPNAEGIARKLVHFITTLGMEGYGEGRMLTLVEAGIREVGQLLLITTPQLQTIQGWGDVLSQQFVTELKSKLNPVALDVLLDASGMFPGIGRKRFHAIVTAIGPNFLVYSSQPEVLTTLLQQVPGIDKLAEVVVTHLPGFIAWLQRYPGLISPVIPASAPVASSSASSSQSGGASLTGQQVVFSGFRDQQLEQAVINAGGKVSNAMSGRVTMVVMKDLSPASIKGKAQEAQQRGIPLITKEDFITRFLNQ